MRDIVWGIALCVALMFVFYFRPLWSARHFVSTDSEDAFRRAYQGRRWVGGEIIAPRGEVGGIIDPAAHLVRSHKVHVVAEELNWSGSHAELVVRQRIVEDNGTSEGASKEKTVYVKLDRRAGRWRYAHFEVRGKRPRDTPIEGNPFDRKKRSDDSTL